MGKMTRCFRFHMKSLCHLRTDLRFKFAVPRRQIFDKKEIFAYHLTMRYANVGRNANKISLDGSLSVISDN